MVRGLFGKQNNPRTKQNKSSAKWQRDQQRSASGRKQAG